MKPSRYSSLAGLALLLPISPLMAKTTALWSFDDPGSPSEGTSRAIAQGTATTGDMTNPLLAGAYRGEDGAYLQGNVTPPVATQPWSVSLWFRSDTNTGSSDNLVGWMRQDNFTLQTLRNNNGSLAFDSGNTSYTWQTASPMDGQWHHAVVTSASGSAPYVLHLDGVQLANPTTTPVSSSGSTQGAFRIGTGGNRGAGNVHDWDGWLDDTTIFDESLGAEVAIALHAMGRLGIPAGEFPVLKSLLDASPGSIMTIAGKSWQRVDSGLAGNAGSYSGTVAAGTAAVVTTAGGAGLRMVPAYAGLADLTAAPASFDESAGFGQATTTSFSLANASGTAPLEWDLVGPPGVQPDLEAVARQFDVARDSILAEIGSRFGKIPVILQPAGVLQDIPYLSSGNQHAFSTFNSSSPKQFPLVPGQTVVTTKEDFSVTGTVRHTTRIAEGFVVVSADCTNVKKLQVGGVPVSGFVNPVTSSSTLTLHGLTWKAWLYRISRTNGPVVHHVFLTPDDPAITGTTTGATTENYILDNLPASCRIHHLWFTREFTVFPEATMLAAAKRFLEATHAPAPWLQPAKSGQLVGPDSGATIPLRFESEKLPPGNYQTSFAIVPKGTDAASLPTEEFIQADFTVLAPEFNPSGPTAEIDTLPGLTQNTEKILVNPEPGVTLGTITAVSGANWLKAIPSENRIGEIDLTVDTTGLAAGTYTTTVTITAGHTTRIITIRIRVANPNYVAILADPGRNWVYLLHSGSPSRMLVLDGVKGTVIREIPVPGAYLMTLAKDGSYLHMLTKPNNRVLSLDLLRMALDAPVPLAPEVTRVNEAFSNLDSGPDGTIYFINGDTGGSLYAVEARTGQVIQRLDTGSLPDSYFGRFRVSQDAKTLYSLHGRGETATEMLPPVSSFEIAGDGSLSPLPATETAWITAVDFSDEIPLVSSADGHLLGMADRVFEPGHFQNTSRQFHEQVKAIAGAGGFVVGSRRIYDSTGNMKLAEMPLPDNPKVIAVTPEGRVFYATKTQYGFVNVPALAGPQAAGLGLFPATGSNGPAPAELRWMPVDGSRDYRLYLSQTETDVESVQPAVTATMVTSKSPWVKNPAAMSPGQTWYWRVDALGPAGLARGEVQSFSVTDFGVAARRITMDVAKGCRAQPVMPPLVIPAGGNPTLAADKPWVKVAASGDAFEVDSTLVPGSGDVATLTYTLHETAVQVPLQVRLHLTDHSELLTGPATSRAFALVQSRSVSDPLNYYGPFFLARLDPASGDMLECLNVGFRARSLVLSRDETELAIESAVSSSTNATGGVEILKAADLSHLKHILAGDGYNTSNEVETALTAGGKMFTGRTLFNWQSGAILGRDNNPGNPLSAFSPDGNSLYGGEINSVFRHDATVPTLPRTALFSRRYGGTDRILMSQDGSLVIYGNMYFDPDLQLLRSSDFVALRTNAEASVVAGSTGIHHTRSLRKIANLPGGLEGQHVSVGFCDDAKTLIYYTANSSGVPDYDALALEPLLTVDGNTLVPAIADGGIYSGETVVLKWSDMPAADSFRVYFGTDEAAIAAAGPGSPLELGVVSAPEWSPAVPLAEASSYFWKVVAEGPGGISSSPVWSFHTPSLSLAKSSMTILCPADSNITDARNSITVATPDTAWSVSTTTPWIEIPQPNGTGSGNFTVRVNPAGFSAETREGSITVTSGAESLTVPVTMETFQYQTVEYLTGRNGPSFHILVYNNRASSSAGPLYLMKVDSVTLNHVETLDLGMTYSLVPNGSLRACHHPADGRIYIYYSSAGRLVGVNAANYRIETNVQTTAPSVDLCPAGPGRLAWITSGSGLTVNEANSATQIAALPLSIGNSPRMLGNPAGNRFYYTDTSSPVIRQFDFSGTQLSAGPTAQIIGNSGVNFNISDDGSTITCRRGYYNADLTGAGQFAQNIIAVNADGSRFLVSTATVTQQVQLTTREGAALGWLPASGKISWNQQTGRIYHRSRTSNYDFVDTRNLDGLALPTLPAGALWTMTGAQRWTQADEVLPVIRTPRAFDIAFSALGRQPSLMFRAPTAGTLSFEARNIGSTNQTVALVVDNATVDTIAVTTSFVTKSRAVSAGSLVAIIYFNGGPATYAEFRNVTFTPAATGASPLLAPSRDQDGDGAEDLLEAALGTDPANAASRPSTRIMWDGGAMVFEFERPVGLPYRYQVQVSSDLIEWEDLNDAADAASAGGFERIRIPIPQGAKRNFARLQVTPLAN